MTSAVHQSRAAIAPSRPGIEGASPAGETQRMTTSAARVEPTEYEMVAGTRSVLDLLAGKWTVEILYLLAGGRRRYSEVYYEVGEISKKVLTRTLRTLERHGLVARTVYAEVPPSR
jgi:DNA-binding HxlR family transcriptional regulator